MTFTCLAMPSIHSDKIVDIFVRELFARVKERQTALAVVESTQHFSLLHVSNNNNNNIIIIIIFLG